MRTAHAVLLLAAGFTALAATPAARPAPPSPAAAAFSVAASGAGSARADGVPLPPDPVITASGVQGSFCEVTVTWSGPAPAGTAFYVLRSVGASTVTVAGPVTGAGILADSVPVASLAAGTLSYTLYSELQSNPAWYNISDPAVVANCEPPNRQASVERTTRPARAPTCSPWSMKTSPFTIV